MGNSLTLEAMCLFLNDMLSEFDANMLLGYGLTLPICRMTTWRWLQRIGTVHGWYKKSYYTDRHEDPDVRGYRAWFDHAFGRCTSCLSNSCSYICAGTRV
jgi:hypothetical protein